MPSDLRFSCFGEALLLIEYEVMVFGELERCQHTGEVRVTMKRWGDLHGWACALATIRWRSISAVAPLLLVVPAGLGGVVVHLVELLVLGRCLRLLAIGHIHLLRRHRCWLV